VVRGAPVTVRETRGVASAVVARSSAPGVKDVAALAGVSPSTVSNYLNRPDVVRPDTKARIDRAVRQLGFVRNESARQLRAGSSRTFALVLLDAWIPFYGELSRGVEDVAAAAGWTVLFSNSARDSDRELRNLEAFEGYRVQGILIVPQQDLRGRLRELQRRGIRCVTLERSTPADDISSVTIDDNAGGRAAARHLIAIGRQNLMLVGNPKRVSHVRDRFAGFSEEIRASSRLRCRLTETEGLTLSDGADAARRILDAAPSDRPDALFAANDLIALGALHELLAAGVDVPEQMAVLGYDGLELAAHARVPLSTVAQPAYAMGVAAAEILIAGMEGREQPGDSHRVLVPEVVVRRSTTPT
jgi:LacI family transcriptional regulator